MPEARTVAQLKPFFLIFFFSVLVYVFILKILFSSSDENSGKSNACQSWDVGIQGSWSKLSKNGGLEASSFVFYTLF